MTIAIRTLLFSAVLAATAGARAAPSGTQSRAGLVYADSGSVFVIAPDGWVLDAAAGRGQGMPAVLYRQGESWTTGDAVMYVSPSRRPPRELAAVIHKDETEFISDAADRDIRPLPAIPLPSRDPAAVRTFVSDTLHSYDAVACVTGERIVWFIVRAARSRRAFEAALPASALSWRRPRQGRSSG